MQSPAPNELRPYGNAGLGGPAGSADPQGAILQRAMAKYQAARSGGLGPAGADITRTTLAGVLVILPVGLLLLGAYGFLSDGSLGGAAFMAVLALLFASIPVIIYLSSRPVTPKATLKAYLRGVARGQFKRARQLVIDPDLDDMPRIQPVIDRLGHPTGLAQAFRYEESFKAYWNGLLRWRPPCYCFVAMSNVRVTEVAPDVALVEAEVKFTMNTSLWALLILVALIIAVIVDVATRTRVTIPVRKVLVRVGNEWRVFNGELMGADEHDLRWLNPNA